MRALKRKAKRVEDKYDIPLKRVKMKYDRRMPKMDFLKYWRVMRYWMRRKYDLKTADLDMLLFLYSEMYFDRERFEEYNNVIGWDTNRMNRMIEAGWIHVWRQKTSRARALYEVTSKARIAVNELYRKLNRDELISEIPHNNPMFKGDVDYADKVYRNFIRKMNLEIKKLRYNERQDLRERQQHLAQVLRSQPDPE
jgi:hypothetical protein